MTRVTINRDRKGRIESFSIGGHTGYSEAGKDIVCASVSAVSGTAVIGLERLLGMKPEVEVDAKEGYLKCVLPDNISDLQAEKANVILETMVLGLKDISVKYNKFLLVLDKEV